MLEGLIGRKVGMTRIFNDDGTEVPVTVIEAGPCPVVMRRTVERDGYDAVQLGFGSKKRPNKPQQGHFGKAKVEPCRVLREFRGQELDKYAVGTTVTVDIFTQGEKVDVQGVTKGKGFQGVVKRHGFAGGPGSHGSNFHRIPGAIGNRNQPGWIFKGKRMGGHMGAAIETAQRLTVVRVDVTKNLLLVKGAIPGVKGSVVEIRRAAKKTRAERAQKKQ